MSTCGHATAAESTLSRNRPAGPNPVEYRQGRHAELVEVGRLEHPRMIAVEFPDMRNEVIAALTALERV